MKAIPLTRGYIAIVDDEDHERLSINKWRYCSGYAARWAPRLKGAPRRLIFMHRIIAGTQKGMDTDHINLDKLDNQKANLRNASRSQNRCNTGIPSTNKTGLKGVRFHTKNRKFYAEIRLFGKAHHIGVFTNPEDAHTAYREASARLHGEFSRTA